MEGGRQIDAPRKGSKKLKEKAAPKPGAAKPTKIKTSGARGMRVGDTVDPNKWRCAVCKHLNDDWEEECTTCHEPKTVLAPEPPARPQKARHVEEEKKRKPHPQPKPKFDKTKGGKKQEPEGPRIATLADLAPKPDNLGGPKVARKWQDSEEETLKVACEH